jgi:hypothetical protein
MGRRRESESVEPNNSQASLFMIIIKKCTIIMTISEIVILISKIGRVREKEKKRNKKKAIVDTICC